MARYTRTPVSTLQGINNELAKVELAMKDTLDRKGVTPNFMDANLDMNSRRILNLPAPLTDQEPLRKGDLPTGVSVSSQYVDDSIKGLTEDYTLRVQSMDDLKALEVDSDRVGERLFINEYHSGTGYGGGEWKVVTGEIANDVYIVQSSSNASIQYKLHVRKRSSLLDKYGVLYDGTSGSDIDNSQRTELAFNDDRVSEYIITNQDKYLLLGDVTLPLSKSLCGIGRNRRYNPSDITSMEGSCCIAFDSSKTNPIQFEGNSRVFNINFWGGGTTKHGVSQGSRVDGMIFENVSMLRYGRGFGTANTINNSRFLLCHANQNSRGFNNLVDSQVTNAEINANTVGVNQQTGSNDTVWTSCKNEFNSEENWKFFKSKQNVVTGGVTDRSGFAGFKITDSEVQVVGVMTRRSGRYILGQSECAHYFIEGAASKVSISNMGTASGVDDDGLGDRTPSYSVSLRGSQAGSVNITGGNAKGCEDSPLTVITTPSEFIASSCIGIEYESNVGYFKRKEGKQGLAVERSNISTGAIVAFTIEQPSIDEYSGIHRVLNISSRNENNGNVRFATIAFTVKRSTSASLSNIAVIAETNTDEIGLTSANDIEVSVGSFSSDGSSFEITLKNNNPYLEKVFFDIS